MDLGRVCKARAARLLFQLPRESRTFKAIEPASQWDWPEALANKTNNLLEAISWQLANQGVRKSKQTKKPEPYVPYFLKETNKEIETHTVDEVKAILAQPRA